MLFVVIFLFCFLETYYFSLAVYVHLLVFMLTRQQDGHDVQSDHLRNRGQANEVEEIHRVWDLATECVCQHAHEHDSAEQEARAHHNGPNGNSVECCFEGGAESFAPFFE